MSQRWPAEIVALGDRLATLSVANANQLSIYLDETYGIAPGFGPLPTPKPEPDVMVEDGVATPNLFDVWLESFDAPHKINVIKVVREATTLGLKDSKDLVEAAPRVVRDSQPRELAEKLRADLEAVGARVSLRPTVA